MTTGERLTLAAALHQVGQSTAEIATRLGVTKRSVRRILLRAGVTEPQTSGHIAPELVNRIAVYASEGMPANWIADDLGLHYTTVLRRAQRAPGHAEHVREWQSTWSQIRNDQRLLALHYEIAPLWSEMYIRVDAA